MTRCSDYQFLLVSLFAFCVLCLCSYYQETTWMGRQGETPVCVGGNRDRKVFRLNSSQEMRKEQLREFIRFVIGRVGGFVKERIFRFNIRVS